MESYMRFMEENPHVGLPGNDEEDVYEYDADGNIIGTEKKVYYLKTNIGFIIVQNKLTIKKLYLYILFCGFVFIYY